MTELEKLKNTQLDTNLLNKKASKNRGKYIRKILTKELLTELILENQYSCYHIVTKILPDFGIKIYAGFIIKLAKTLNIKTKNIKEICNSPLVLEKRKETCRIKYGADNCLSKNTSAYKKRNNTIIEKYGCENVFQLESVKTKSKETLFDKYGIQNPCELPYYERNNGRRSKIQIKIENFLTEINIDFQIEVGKIFRKDNYSPIVDILISDKKIIFEIYGDKWHANPLKYKSNDLIKTWDGWLTAEQIWKKDKKRQEQLESFGYKVIILWENDIRRNFDVLKEYINENLQN